VTLREQVRQRNLQWRSFNEWEAAQPPVSREPAAILADLEWLKRLSGEARENQGANS
jgi:hypothetical protein